MNTIYRKNDNVIEWTWLSQSTDNAYVNDGNVTFTLYSGYAIDSTTGVRLPSSGAVNVLVFGPEAMAYVEGSNGKYQGKIPASLNLNLALDYTIEINATA